MKETFLSRAPPTQYIRMTYNCRFKECRPDHRAWSSMHPKFTSVSASPGDCLPRKLLVSELPCSLENYQYAESHFFNITSNQCWSYNPYLCNNKILNCFISCDIHLFENRDQIFCFSLTVLVLPIGLHKKWPVLPVLSSN